MPVAFESAGYGGALTQASWAELASQLGHTYSVEGEESWVVAPATGDRAVTVGPGTGTGHGVRDTTADIESLFLPAVTSGTVRYDLIVARRNWSTKVTSFAIVEGGATRAVPSRAATPGFLDEHPIALVRVSAGSTAIGEVTDLRTWGGPGGLYAKSDLARSFIGTIGSQVNINGVLWQLQLGTNNLPTWTVVSEVGKIPMFGLHGSLNGSPNAGVQFLVQGGTYVDTTDNSGYARLHWPKPFPNGLHTVTLISGDDWVNGRVAFFNVAGRPDVFGDHGYGSKTEVVYVMQGSDGAGNNWGKVPNKLHRINYIAIGW